MARDLTAAVEAELDKNEVRLGLFVEIIFDGGPFRVWSGVGVRTLGGNSFTGVGNFGGIDKIEESAGDIRAAGIAMTLSGIDVTLLSIALQEEFQGRPVTVWLQMFDIDWGEIGDPIQLNKYRCDYPVIDKGGETFSITVFAESMLADLERPRVRRFTHEDQQALSPGDTFLSRVASIQSAEIVWTKHE